MNQVSPDQALPRSLAWRFAFVALPLLLTAAAWLTATAWGLNDPLPETEEAKPKVAFNRDIRPILSDRCFKCHGFDAKARKADLRLDTWEGLTSSRKGSTPVVPGDPSASELLNRVHADDPQYLMPPPSSQLELSEQEKDLLEEWILQGAPFEDHWAFVEPTRTEPEPSSKDSWSRTPIDQFIYQELERNGLQPSPDADRETLIRRASLDITGLPPTPLEIEAFVNDKSPDAYERLVDRLLSSDHYGERLALMWLDAARYADTNGFHHDNIRTGWPYRDWVIEAFNRNQPFDEFVVDQLAGDLLPNPSERQQIATAFCRMHNINDEGGALDEEYRVEAVADRIETVATVFMGLTFTCARCHDHKYDPFTQEDYYSLYSFFNTIDERGVYPANFEQARAYPARLLYFPGDLKERLRLSELEIESAKAELETAQPAILHEWSQWERDLQRTRQVEWIQPRLVEAKSRQGSDLTPSEDGSVRVSGESPPYDVHTFSFETEQTQLRLLQFEVLIDAAHPTGTVGLNTHGNAVISSLTLTATSLKDPSKKQEIPWSWAWADHEQANGDFDVLGLLDGTGQGWAVDGHQKKDSRTALFLSEAPFGFPGGTRLDVAVGYESPYGHHIAGRTRIRFGHTSTEIIADFPRVTRDWWSIGPFGAKSFEAAFETAFGPEEVSVIDRDQIIAKKRWKHRPELEDGKVHTFNGSQAAHYFARSVLSPIASTMTLSLGSDDGVRVFRNGEEVFQNKVRRGTKPNQDTATFTLHPGENIIVVKIINDGGPGGIYTREISDRTRPGFATPVALIDESMRDSSLHDRAVSYWGRENSAIYETLSQQLAEAEANRKALDQESVPVLIMSENEELTPTYVLERGQYNAANKERPVDRRPPTSLGDLQEDLPRNRLGFARWLVRDDHPLTSRVHVNRLWQMIFGTGIVATSENFGLQSDWPSHPQLLDWLATTFVESGWDQKALLRLIFTSSVYRQQSQVRLQAQEIDPNNRLLASFPRQRLPGEMIRDQALFAAGLLNPKIGGPSVKPYQPDGLWREVSIGASSNTQVFRRDQGDALYRRSLYTFWKRTSPNPQMQTFDVPTREFCVVRRNTTNTPLQALVLWNDVQFLEASRVLAQRTLEEDSQRPKRITALYQRTVGRKPQTKEIAVIDSTLNDLLARYRQQPEEAEEVIALGEAPTPETYDPAELAAWTLVSNMLMSLDEAIVRD